MPTFRKTITLVMIVSSFDILGLWEHYQSKIKGSLNNLTSWNFSWNRIRNWIWPKAAEASWSELAEEDIYSSLYIMGKSGPCQEAVITLKMLENNVHSLCLVAIWEFIWVMFMDQGHLRQWSWQEVAMWQMTWELLNVVAQFTSDVSAANKWHSVKHVF